MKDIDGDGRKDLLVSHIQLGFWNTVRSLVAKQTSVETAAFLLNAADRYPAKPDFQTDSTYKLDLGGTVSFHGVWPTLEGDFTGEGHADLLVARDGSVTVYPADEGDPLFASPHSQSDLPIAPFRHVVDLNRDGRDDLLFYEKKNKGRISVLVNTGDWTAKKASSRGAQPTAR